MYEYFKHREWKVRLVVNNYLEDKDSSNVIGVIRGQVEPDRYIIIGTHFIPVLIRQFMQCLCTLSIFIKK